MNEYYELPNDYDAECAVIISMLKDPSVVESVIELNPEAFYDNRHYAIYSAMQAVHLSGKKIDYVTILDELKSANRLEQSGGMSYLTDLHNAFATPSNVEQYAEIVQTKHVLRQIATSGAQQRASAFEGGDISETIARLQQTVNDLQDQVSPKQEFRKIGDVVPEVIDRAEELAKNENKGGVTGTSSGFADLDKMTAGFQDGDLIIVAARPSVGKTAFALNIAQNAAIDFGKTAAVFSLEMSAPQLVQRMICADQNIAAEALRTGDLKPEDWQKIVNAAGRFESAEIYIDDSSALTVGEIRAKCRRLKKAHGLDMIVIDYLQLISGRGKSGENRQQEVSEISRTLKQIARELEVPVIALSQLSRGVEQRQDKRPMMSDLRESGAIEQDADIVAFLYRDDYYNADTEKKNIIEIILAKQRNGPVGTVELVFLKQFNKFVNYDRAHGNFDAGMEKRYG